MMDRVMKDWTTGLERIGVQDLWIFVWYRSDGDIEWSCRFSQNTFTLHNLQVSSTMVFYPIIQSKGER
jgi:hypothetical protein